MIWLKNNKIVTDGTNIIQCQKCPCNDTSYYAVFGIKQRSLNCETMQPNDACSWSNSVIVAKVENGTFKYWENIYLPVKAKKGLCLQKKGKWNCSIQCDEWDQQTGECISEFQYCDCYQFKVYNLTGCYYTYQEFAKVFYSKCGVEADQNGNYPDIWQQWYGDYITTSDADRCLQEWDREFNRLYSLNYIINYKECWQRWRWDCSSLYYPQIKYYWCTDTEDCSDSWIERNQDNSCPEGTKQCQDTQAGFNATGVYSECWEQSRATDGYFKITHQFDENTSWQDGMDCCAEKSGISVIPQMNETVRKAVTDTSIYYARKNSSTNCVNDNDLCVSFEYRSGCVDNYYGTTTGAKSNFYLYKLSLSRNENTPEDAVGVRFKVKKIHIKENVGLGHESKSEQTTNQIYDLYFDGEEKITDLATDVTYFGVIQSPNCDSDCSYSEDYVDWQIQPYVMFSWAGYQEWQQNNLYDEYKYELVAERYLTADDLTTE